MEGMMSVRLLIAFSMVATFCIVSGSSVYSCPSVCICYVDDHGFRTANCTGVKFLYEYKYNKLFPEIDVLNIEPDSYDDRTILRDDMFSSLSKLKILSLSKCKINYLPKNVFKGLKKIYEINLSYNDIRHFDNSVFENSYTLYKLNLRGNALLATYKPFISSSSLRELDLGYCSMIVLQNEFFHGVKSVTHLNLDGNHLQTIKEHVLPRGIIHLNLASNRIVNVPISTISSLSQLRWLNLGANPINCTCQLLNLQDRLSGRGIIIDGDVRCAYPLELENVSWSKINENELCNKEMFRSRPHNKKSQFSKYIHSQKKDQYFENEKYSSFESFQGDDPRKSGDDDYDNLLSEEGYDESKDVKTSVHINTNSSDDTSNKQENNSQIDKILHENPKEKNLQKDEEKPSAEINSLQTEPNEPKPQNLIEHEKSEDVTPKFQSSSEIPLQGLKNDNILEKTIGHPAGEHKENGPSMFTSINVTDDTENEDNSISEKRNITSDIHEQEFGDGAAENEEDMTAPPITTDSDFIISDPEIAEKSNLDNLDEGLKREDEILPVVESPHSEPETAKNIDNEKNDKIVENNIDVNKTNGDIVIPILEDTIKHDTDKPDHERLKNADIEPTMIAKNESKYFNANRNDLEESSDINDHQNLNAGQIEQVQKENSNEENLLNHNGETEKTTSSSITTPVQHVSSEKVAEHEGQEISDTGEDPFYDTDDIHGVNIAMSTEIDTALEVTPESTPISPPEFSATNDPNSHIKENSDSNNESSLRVVDKSDITYEAVGSYIVVLGIIILVSILILITIYKGLCKSKKSNGGKPVPADVEANNGTELQDMKSLLQKTTVNDEKHNNKYPNELPSPETVNLIKEDKTDEAHESHDLNQNDSKNEPVIKNGKAPEGTPPPIEKTKAKLTVLLESIPRTPIFVQKRSATINNG